MESLRESPSGRDTGDRTAEGDRPGLVRDEEGRPGDAFMSSEVNDRTSRPGRPDKTRS